MDIPIISQNDRLKQVMQKINEKGFGIAFAVDREGRLVGVVTDGDIRRAILNGISLKSKISVVLNKNPVKGYTSWSSERLEKFLHSSDVLSKASGIRPLIVPILNDQEMIVDFRIVFDGKSPLKQYDAEILKKLSLPKKILVLGGAGYIGSVLVRMMLEIGYSVKVMDSLVYGDFGIRDLYSSSGFELYEGDLTNVIDIVEALRDVDAVIHLAAIVGDPAGKMKPTQTLQVNYFSTNILVDIAKYLGISRFIFASTCSVYGFKEDLCKEDDEPNPLSLYAETKKMSEEVILERQSTGFCPTILRFATVYGLSPRMRFDLVVNLLIAKAEIDRKITVYGKGVQKRPFVHIRDVCRAILKVLEASPQEICGEIYNVGSEGQNMSIRELAEIINREIPEATIETITEKEDDRSYVVSYEKLHEKLKFTPEESISTAIKEIQDFIKGKEIKKYRDKKYSNYKSLKES